MFIVKKIQAHIHQTLNLQRILVKGVNKNKVSELSFYMLFACFVCLVLHSIQCSAGVVHRGLYN